MKQSTLEHPRMGTDYNTHMTPTTREQKHAKQTPRPGVIVAYLASLGFGGPDVGHGQAFVNDSSVSLVQCDEQGLADLSGGGAEPSSHAGGCVRNVRRDPAESSSTSTHRVKHKRKKTFASLLARLGMFGAFFGLFGVSGEKGFFSGFFAARGQVGANH